MKNAPLPAAAKPFGRDKKGLLLAITVGGVSKQAGGGIYLVVILGQMLPCRLPAVMLPLLTMTRRGLGDLTKKP